jgi:RNA polymerase sigma factor (sigma-70 family)
MSESRRANPYYEGEPHKEGSDIGSQIPSGKYTHGKQIESLAQYYTGDKNTYLSFAQEVMLAELIQDGIKAEQEIAQIEELSEIDSDAIKQLKAAYARRKGGRDAAQVLVEANMRFAAYFARASVGIVNPLNPQKTTKAKPRTSDRYRGKNKKPERVGTYTDITGLRSPHAELEDRIQQGYMGLVEAARKYIPRGVSVEGSDENNASFATFAASNVQAAIHRFTPYETLGWRLPREEAQEVKQYSKELNDALDENRDPVLDPQLEQMMLGRDTVPIDELSFAAAPEEADEFGEGINLGADELLHDDNAYTEELAARHILRQHFIEILDTIKNQRDAGIVMHRYGFEDGSPRTNDEIAKIYGISKDRVGQIQSKIIEMLRHPSKTGHIRDFMESDTLPLSPYFSGDNIRTPHQPVSHPARMATLAIQDVVGFESWQAKPDDIWEKPVRSGIVEFEEHEHIEYEIVERGFEELLLNANPYHFQESFARSMGSEYPRAFIERVDEIFGRNLTPDHIEKFWNTQLETFIDKIQQSVGEDFSYERFGQFFAALLRDRMTEEDNIALTIPPSVDGKLTYIGAWQRYGILTINGNVGDHAGYKASNLANITINGDTGVAVGAQATDLASIRVIGNAGDMAGFEMGGSSTLVINGNAGDFAGACIKSGANITIHGTVGDYAACEVNSDNVVVEINGSAGESFGDKSTKGDLLLAGEAKSITPNNDFSGRLVVNGKLIET